MKGRKPVPLALKILRGTRRRTSTDEEPVMLASTPRMPSGLTRIERAYWGALVKSLTARRTLHDSMQGILEVAVNCYDQWRRCRKACKESSVYETRSREGAVIWKQKPEVAIGIIARKQLVACLCELGLTPVSAARVHPLPLAKKPPRDGLASYFSTPDPLKPSA